MTALAAAAARSVMDWTSGGSYPVLAATQIWKGAIVAVDANGYAIPATDTANTWVVGVASESVLGGTASGDEWVKVEAGRAYLFAASSITQAMVGEPMYVVDDNTVDDAAGATNDVMVGLLVKYVSSTSGWVFVAPTYSLGQIAGVTSSAGELNYLDITAAGTVEASKACVVNATKDLGDFRNLDAVNIDAGASGTAGTVDVFPTSAASGKLAITAADNAGDTTTTIVNASQAAARTYTIPDAGAAASFVLSTGTSTATACTSTELDKLDESAAAGCGFCYASGTLSNAELVALRAAPITAIAAPGAGKAIVPMMVSLFLDYAGADIVQVNNADHMALRYSGGVEICEIGSEAQCTAFLESVGADAALTFNLSGGWVPTANEAVQFDNNGAAEWTNVGGTSVIDYYIVYAIVPVA